MSELSTNPHFQAFVRACSETPNDDTPRYALTDWLEEEGIDDPLIEFIRAQLAVPPQKYWRSYTDRERELDRRQQELLAEHGAAWRAPLEALGVTDIAFARGFPNKGTVSLSTFLEKGEALFNAAPLVELTITGVTSASGMQQLVAS